MLRFFYNNIVIGTDTQSPSRTVDPAQLDLMFVDDGSMDFLLSKADVVGLAPQFASHHTTASDDMLARMVPMLAARGIEFGVSGGGPIGYGCGALYCLSGVYTPTQQGQLSAANDLEATGLYGYLESKGVVIDWNIIDSPLDRVTLNGNNKAAHISHHGFGSAATNDSTIYTARTAGAAGNNITIAHVISGNNTDLSVTASTVNTLVDDFGRTTVDGWGSPDTGPAYALTGTAANFDVAAGVGTIALPTAPLIQLALDATTSLTTTNPRGHVIFSLDAVPDTANTNVSVLLRATDANNYYGFRAVCKPDGHIQASIYKTVAGVDTVFITTTNLSGLTLAGGTQFWLEGKAVGSALSCTIWAVGTTRPVAASTTFTDTTFASAGKAGIRVSTNGSSGSLPRTVSLDTFKVSDVAQDGTAIVVHLATDSGGVATSTAADIIAAVNADPDATALVVASSAGGTGLVVPVALTATNLDFGDDGVNFSNTDTATAIVSYITAVHAVRPNMKFGFTVDVRRPYNGVGGYSSQAYPSGQMPDFKDFWPIFWAQIGAAGLKDVFKLVMYDTTPELQGRLADAATPQASYDDWWLRLFAIQRQIEADGVIFTPNFGQSINSQPANDASNSVGPASEESNRAHCLQYIHDLHSYRKRFAPDLDRFGAFVFGPFGYYPRVQLPVSDTHSEGRQYLSLLAAFDRDDFPYLVEGPTLRQITPGIPDPVGFQLRVEKPSEVLASGLFGTGALYRWERSTNGGSTWSELGTGAILAGTWKYDVYDTGSAAGYQYRARISRATPIFAGDYGAYGPVVTV